MLLGKAAEYGFLNARCHSIRSQLITYESLQDLATSRGIGELFSSLEATPYAPFLTTVSTEGIHRGLSDAFKYHRKQVFREIKKTNIEVFKLFFETKYSIVDKKTLKSHEKNPEEYFHTIDKNYITMLKKSISKLQHTEQMHLKKILGSYFDLLNLYNLVKFRLLYNLTIEETLTYMFPYAENFNINNLALLCDINNIQELSNKIENIVGESFDSYEGFRKVLYKYHLKRVLSIWSGFPFSIAIPFSLLRLIEIEISNLRTITEGVMHNIGSKEINEMIVGS